MGQKQLLLVILVTIAVGFATVFAINSFGSSTINANRDAVRNDVATIATAAIDWHTKPEVLGGGNNSFTNLTFNDIVFSADSIFDNGLSTSNLNGIYVLSLGSATSITVTATPTSNFSAKDPIIITGTATPSGLTLAEEAIQ